MKVQHILPVFAASSTFALNFDIFRRHSPASEHNEEASHLVKRLSDFTQLMVTDLQNLTTVTHNITDQIMKFANASDLNQAIVINTTTGYLFEALDKATADAKTGDSISSTDAQALGPPTQLLAYAANESIAALILKKPFFKASGLQSLVVTSLESQIKASADFSKVLLSKVPQNLLPVSEALNSQVSDSLVMGLECFQDKNSSCNSTPVNATRTIQAAQDSGAIPKGAAPGRMSEISSLLVVGATVAVGILFAA